MTAVSSISLAFNGVLVEGREIAVDGKVKDRSRLPRSFTLLQGADVLGFGARDFPYFHASGVLKMKYMQSAHSFLSSLTAHHHFFPKPVVTSQPNVTSPRFCHTNIALVQLYHIIEARLLPYL